MTRAIKILVTPLAFSKISFDPNRVMGEEFQLDFTYDQLFKKSKLINKLSDVQGAVIGVENITKEVLEQVPSLKIISRFGGGYDSIDIEAAKDMGVKVAVVPHGYSKAVARHAIVLAMSLCHNIIDYARRPSEGLWNKKMNVSPSRKVFGVIGLGRIGLETAVLAQKMGFQVAYYSRGEKNEGKTKRFKYFDDIEKLIDNSDIISLHLKSFSNSNKVLNRDRLELLKGKYFINTARGNLVDEEALFEFLSSGFIKGAALDVLNSEPPEGLSKKIMSLSNVIVTPHVGIWDEESVDDMARSSIMNIKHYFEGNLTAIDKLIC